MADTDHRARSGAGGDADDAVLRSLNAARAALDNAESAYWAATGPLGNDKPCTDAVLTEAVTRVNLAAGLLAATLAGRAQPEPNPTCVVCGHAYTVHTRRRLGPGGTQVTCSVAICSCRFMAYAGDALHAAPGPLLGPHGV